MNSCPCVPPLLAAPCAPPSPSLPCCRRPKGRSPCEEEIHPLSFFPLCLCLDLGLDFSSNREVLVVAVLFCSLGSCSRSNIFLGLLCAEFGQTMNTKVIDIFNTFPESIHSLIVVLYSGSYDYWKFVVSCGFRIQLTLSVLGGRLICLRGRICLWLYGRC
jgi:hypothetical protein